MRTILLIEDNPDNARIARRVLERAGHHVIVTGMGLRGLQIATEEHIDLVLMDMHLPDVEGHTVTALLRRLPQQVPVLALSADTTARMKTRALNAGCRGYFTKPINTRTFAQEIEPYFYPPEARI